MDIITSVRKPPHFYCHEKSEPSAFFREKISQILREANQFSSGLLSNEKVLCVVPFSKDSKAVFNTADRFDTKSDKYTM